MQGAGCRDWSVGLVVYGLEFREHGSGVGVLGESGCRV